jgi:ABC-type antimicrobial peptide transport system permease subunit
MEKALQILLIILLSSTKFLTAPITALNIGFGYLQTLLITTIGGIIGVLFFFFLSNMIMLALQKLSPSMRFSKTKTKKRKFTWKNKLIVRVKRDFGLVGLAALTPTILSIPVGTFLAARYFENRIKVLSYLIISVCVWSIIISSVVIIF